MVTSTDSTRERTKGHQKNRTRDRCPERLYQTNINLMFPKGRDDKLLVRERVSIQRRAAFTTARNRPLRPM